MNYTFENYKKGKLQGILQPVIQNRWTLRIPHKDKDIEKLISMQVIRCKMDYVGDTLEVILEQDAITPLIHEMVRGIRKELRTVYIEYLAGDDKPTAALEFKVRLKEHEFVLDYAKNGTAYHRLLFDIKTLIPYGR